MNAPHHNSSADREAGAVLNSLAALARRGRTIVLFTGAGWILAGGMLFIIVFIAALGWWGGSALRALGWAGFAVGLAVLAIVALFRPLLSLSKTDDTARRVGRVFPDQASLILSGSQLAVAQKANRLAFSTALVARHLKSANEALFFVPKGRVFPVDALAAPIMALLAAALITGAMYAFLPQVVRSGLEILWRDPTLPEPEPRFITAKAPVIGDLALTLRYPEYLQRPDRRLVATSGGVVAPLGTNVIVEGKSLVEGADRGDIRLPDGGQHQLAIDHDGRIKGRFVVNGPGPFCFRIGTSAVMMEGPKGYLDVQMDPPPSIRLLRCN